MNDSDQPETVDRSCPTAVSFWLRIRSRLTLIASPAKLPDTHMATTEMAGARKGTILTSAMERYRLQVHFQVVLHESNVEHLRCRIPEFLPDVGRNDDPVNLLLVG